MQDFELTANDIIAKGNCGHLTKAQTLLGGQVIPAGSRCYLNDVTYGIARVVVPAADYDILFVPADAVQTYNLTKTRSGRVVA